MPPWISPIALILPVSHTPWHVPINQSLRPDLASIAGPHGASPQITSIARSSHLPPWRAPINQSHRPDPAKTGTVCARCSWSQVSTFQHYCNLPLVSSLRQSLYSSPRPYPPPHPLSIRIRRPSPLLPYAPDFLLPPSPFIRARAFWTLPVTLPVNHTFHFGSPPTTYRFVRGAPDHRSPYFTTIVTSHWLPP